MPNDRDETVERVRAALKPLPPTDAHAVARVLSAVHGRAPKPTPRWREWLDWMRMPSLSIVGATGLVAAAMIAGYVVNGQFASRTNDAASSQTVAASPNTVTPIASPIIPAAAAADAERAIPTQFVLDLPDAKSVSIVGDFNSWAIGEAPLQMMANGVWNITLPIKPGRHEYSFVVDGKRWMADPRAPKASNSDFGKPGSVIMVTSP
ncbi:MAG: isoamylase early set domain-containing protein [Gemmatimonadaceae bacterium]